MENPSPNYDADVHDLKGKLSEVEKQLPEFDKFKEYVVDTLDEENFQKRITGLTKQRIEILKAGNRIKSICTDFQSSYNKIIESYRLVEPDSFLKTKMDELEKKRDITGKIRSMKMIQINLADILIEIDEHILLMKELREAEESSVDPSSTITNVPILPETRKSSIKLNSVDVPEFNGEPENFLEFISAFDELVHNNDELAEIEKGIRLKQCLKGRAEMCIKGIPITKENYKVMYSKLKRKFENASVNKHAIVEKLERLTESGKGIDECIDKLSEIEVIINQLECANMSITDSTNLVFHRMVLAKFPQYIVEKVIEKTEDDKFTVDQLMRALEKVIYNKNFSQKAMTRSSGKSMNHQARNNNADRGTNNSHSEKQNTPNNAQNEKKTACAFCPTLSNHNSLDCRKPVNMKIDILRKERLCWKCFEGNHTSKNCRLENCSCNGPHNISVCRRQNNDGNRHTYNRNNTFNTNENGRNYSNNNQNETNFTPQQSNNATNTFGRENQRSGNHQAYMILEDDNLQSHHSALQIKAKNELPALMTCAVEVFDPVNRKHIRATIFIDSGSQVTLIDETLYKALGIRGGDKKSLTLNGIHPEPLVFESKEIAIQIRTTCNKHMNIQGLTKAHITKGFRSAKLSEDDLQYIQTRGISLVNDEFNGKIVKPEILIGIDNYHKIVMNKESIELPSGLHMVETIFGYCVFGTAKGKGEMDRKEEQNFVMHNCIIETEDEINPNEMLKEMYELESLGIRHDGSPSDERVITFYEDFKRNISFEENIVTAPFPLKEDLSRLGPNYNLAYKQLDSLVSKLKGNIEMNDHYTRKLVEYERDGIIEAVTAENEIPNKVADFYIPHHGVWNAEKREKPLRIVFGAQAKQKDCISLNEAIETGESFVNKIADIIMSARKSKFIIVSDIQGAFTQIRMIPEHQDLCRFLWLKDPAKSLTKDNLVIYRFKRLPFGITASPAILNMSITAFLENEGSELGREILENIYVDNVLLLADEIEDVKRKITESKELFGKISFNLREYVTNNNDLNNDIPEIDRGKFGNTKILGVDYNTDSDEYKAKIDIKSEQIITKRTVLKQLHSIFDPIGLLTPAVISLRSLMREVFSKTKHWSDQLPRSLHEKWVDLINEVNKAEVVIPRYIGKEHEKAEDQIVWIFTDASKDASAACAYVQDKNTAKLAKLICGKAKLTPRTKKPLEDTIPKFEFASILLGLEAAKNVIRNLKLQGCLVRIVNDSTSALSWIGLSKSLRRSCQIIRDKIRSAVSELERNQRVKVSFYHCPSEFNVADISTRGWPAHELQESEWIHGPKWLKYDTTTIPLKEFFLEKITEPVEEVPRESVAMQISAGTEQNLPKKLFNLKRFSSTKKAKWAVAYLMNRLSRHLIRIREKLGNSNDTESLLGKMTGRERPSCEDLKRAEYVILKDEQSAINIEEIKARYKQKEVFKDENNIIRFTSRIMNADLPRDTLQPIFIPHDSDWVKMRIQELHNDNCHCGKDYILMLLRQECYVPRPSKTVNEILRKCLPCRIQNSVPFRAPQMADLPKDRLVKTAPFSNTGIDFLGPFEIKDKEQAHVCLFTCLVTRCIHLEITSSMAGAEFLKCFMRFVSRRGKPKLIRSDNGTNFVLGWKIIENLNENPIHFCTENDIEWIFNPPSSPWMGGCWEICVKMVKQAFYKTVGRNKLTYDDFHTMITKIEAVVNSRPLTIFSEDNLNPLKPSDFLIPRIDLILPNLSNTSEEQDYEPDINVNQNEARKMIRTIERLTETFWNKFKAEYLPKLRDSQRMNLKQGKCAKYRLPENGEVVIVEDDMLPRYKWNLATILETYKGKDGFVRTALIECNGKHLIRPIVRLYPLEILTTSTKNEKPEIEKGNTLEKSDNQDNNEGVVERPVSRQAHIMARSRIRKQISNEIEEMSSDEFSNEFNDC